ncbi:hypothetical protein LOAG_04789 [Loa loa]|uniref:Uncharacterized protein n=1 Tax=Loa loa TaxID=7209 RepID=A0A1S0U1E0_LOALO|nr:hypothetical protein LOAG_04789 [Loa loa]EFO23694.1 hypothetical protein LOAG_04789 [Loa loa]
MCIVNSSQKINVFSNKPHQRLASESQVLLFENKWIEFTRDVKKLEKGKLEKRQAAAKLLLNLSSSNTPLGHFPELRYVENDIRQYSIHPYWPKEMAHYYPLNRRHAHHIESIVCYDWLGHLSSVFGSHTPFEGRSVRECSDVELGHS